MEDEPACKQANTLRRIHSGGKTVGQGPESVRKIYQGAPRRRNGTYPMEMEMAEANKDKEEHRMKTVGVAKSLTYPGECAVPTRGTERYGEKVA